MYYFGNTAFKMNSSNYSLYPAEPTDGYITRMVKSESNSIIERGAYSGIDLIRKMQLDVILSERNITSLMHFTSLKALPHIIKDGLMPRCVVDEHYHIDHDRSDNMPHCSCFTISYPNGWVLNSYMSRFPEKTFVILEYDSDIILNHPSYFIPHNAACRISSAANRYRNWPEDLERLFSDTSLSPKGVRFTRAALAGKPNLPTDQQAEILIEGIIPKKELKRIIVDSDISKKKVLSALSKIDSNIKVDVDARYFTQNRENSGIF